MGYSWGQEIPVGAAKDQALHPSLEKPFPLPSNCVLFWMCLIRYSPSPNPPLQFRIIIEPHAGCSLDLATRRSQVVERL